MRVALPTETVVELIGVTDDPWRHHPSWWHPDGVRLDSAPAAPTVRVGLPDDGGLQRVFLLRIHGLRPQAAYHIHALQMDGPRAILRDGSPQALRVFPLLEFADDVETATLIIGFTLGEWETVLRFNQEGEQHGKRRPLGRGFEFVQLASGKDSGFASAGNGSVLVFRIPAAEGDRPSIAHRVQVVDQSGTAHDQVSSQEETGRQQKRMHYYFAVKPENIREIQVQVEAYRYWVTFKEVSLWPDKRTNVESRTEALETE